MDNMLKQSTAVTALIGPFINDSDGKTAETALTIAQADVRLSKNGGNMAQKNESTSCTHDELGYYTCPLDTTDTGTLGKLKLMVSESGALPVWVEYTVVPAEVYDSLVLGTDYLPADTKQVEGVDATNQIRDAVVDDATRIDASKLNTLAGHDPGATLGTADAGDKMDIVDAPNSTAVTAIQSGLSTFAASDTVARVTLVDTTTTNTDMRGTNSAALASAYTSTRAGKLDNLDVAISTRGTADTGDAMTLTAAYDAAKTAAPAGEYDTELDVAVSTRSSHSAADVWTSTTRTLSSFGSLVADTATAVWSAAARTITDKTGFALTGDYDAAKTAAPANEYDTEMAHLDADVSSRSSHTAASIWSVATRALTDKADFTLSAAYDAAKSAAPSAADIATAVWAAGTRTLSSFGTLVADIWASVARTLTDKTGYALTAAYDPTKTTAQTGEAATAVGTLNDFDPANDTVAHVTLVDTTTTNTDMRGTNSAYTGTPPTVSEIAAEVWSTTTRTLSSYGSLVADAAAAVWATVSRTITGTVTVADKTGFALTGDYDAAKTAAPANEYDTEMARLDVAVSTRGTADTGDAMTLTAAYDAAKTAAPTGEAATAVATLNDFDPVNDTVAHVTLVDTTTTNTDMRGTDDVSVSAPTVEEIAAGLHDFDPATDVVAHVTLVDTTTENTDMRGTDTAYTGTPPTVEEIRTEMESAGTILDKLVDTVEDDGGVYRFTANALEEAPSGSGATAEDVWTYATRAVTDKTGYALTEAYNAAKTAAQAGAEMDLVDAPNATAVTAIQSGLAPANEYDAKLDVAISTRSSHSAADVDTTLTSTHGSGSWSGSAGSGVNTVTVTVATDDAAIPGISVTIRNTAGTTLVAGPLATDENGEVVFNLNDGDYVASTASTPLYTGVSQSFTVASEPLAVTVTVEALAIPAATDPSLCAVYGYLRGAGGVLVGEGVGSITVTGVPYNQPVVSTDSIIGYSATDVALTNSVGLVELELIRGVEYTLEVDNGLTTRTITVEVPDATSYNLTEELG